jgi:hypothetical protein
MTVPKEGGRKFLVISLSMPRIIANGGVKPVEYSSPMKECIPINAIRIKPPAPPLKSSETISYR